MELKDYILEVKSDYAQNLLAGGSFDRAKEVMESDVYSPLFLPRYVHDQSEPVVKEYNEMIKEAYYDIHMLRIGLSNSAKEYKDLMLKTDLMLKEIKNELLIQKEKQDDINILCNAFTDFEDVIQIDLSSLGGEYSLQDNIIGAKITSHNKVSYNIQDINGNGYEGNRFVYEDGSYLSEKKDTSNRNAIKDNNPLTVYEYSRITCSNSEKEIFEYANKDSIEARCIINLVADASVNKISVNIGSADSVIAELSTSEDGISFKNILAKPISPNNIDNKYKEQERIPGSGLVCFPNTKYIRIVLESNAKTNDQIAFEKTSVYQKITASSAGLFKNHVSALSFKKGDIADVEITPNDDFNVDGVCKYCSAKIEDKTQHKCLLSYSKEHHKIITTIV